MFTLTFSLIAQGNYTISDTNDNRLFCIGCIIVDPVLRRDVKKALYYAAEIGMEQAKHFETDLNSLNLKQADDETILIKLTPKIDERAPGERVPYETDIPLEEFINLVEDFEDALESDARLITVTRIQDSFELTITG